MCSRWGRSCSSSSAVDARSTGSTPAATLKRVRGDVTLPVGSLPAEVPDDVRAAILKATDSQADRR